jgi:outer membrane usher protein
MAQSKRLSRWWRATSLSLLLLAALAAISPAAWAQQAISQSGGDDAAEPDPMDLPPADPVVPPEGQATLNGEDAGLPASESPLLDLQLEVKINGYAISLVAGFKMLDDGHIATQRSELEEIGIAVPGSGKPEEVIALDDLPGLSYVYDEENQAIELEVPDNLRLARNIEAQPKQDMPVAEAAPGIAVNYTAFAAASYDIPRSDESFDGANLSLDARAFSKFGTLRQTGIVGTTRFNDAAITRLDTTFSWSDQKRMVTYRLGDIISGGLSWTRPVRLGGVQMQRNFSLRPDLVTMPLPHLKGSAAVPSVLDVYLDQVKAYSSDLEPGPFNIDSLPVFTNSGTARIVLTDATGRTIETDTPFYTSPRLLKHGLWDFSADAGVVRRDFGRESFGYADEPVGLASFRYGLADWITLEGHAEGKGDLLNGGLGATVSLRRFGVLGGAVAASKHGRDEGVFVHGDWQAQFGDLSVYASTSRRFGNYYDLAAATVEQVAGKPLTSDVPWAVDQLSVGYNWKGLEAGTGLSLIHQELSNGDETLLLSGSLSKPFDNGVSIYASAFYDILDSKNYGAFAGISVPLSKRVNASSSATITKGEWSARAEVSRPMNTKVGDYGWRVAHTEGDGLHTSEANGVYRSKFGVAEGNIYQQNRKLSGNLAFSGAVAAAGGGVFASNQINDAFAVVKVGAPGVKVTAENNYVGTTGKNGRLLIPNLRSFDRNKIAIDVNDLPVTAMAAEAERIAVPRDSAGVVVDFGVNKDAGGVILTLNDASGQPLEAGLEARLNEGAEPFIMGYDGQIFLTGAQQSNTVVVSLANGTCTVAFDYKSDGSGQTPVGPLTCTPDQ